MIDCEDQIGLIRNISTVLVQNQLNIISQGEFVEQSEKQFFLRTEFSGSFEEGILLEQLKKALPEDSTIRLVKNSKKRIIILATKEYHCLGDLLLRHAHGDLNAEILAVISNHDTLRSLSQSFSIPFHFITHQQKSREQHEREVLDKIFQYDYEYLVLAKYMRILTPSFVEHFSNRIINIHHSFLPAFAGASPYRQAYNRGVKIIGATAHFVNDKLDDGAIIAQGVTPVDHSLRPVDMARAGRDVERTVLAKALKFVFEERVFVSGKGTIIFE